jgi:50S ribosomal protein L16 3-hydroxylase
VQELVEDVLRPLGLEGFRRSHYLRSPFGFSGTAEALRELSAWDTLEVIFAANHGDCWLPCEGRLPADEALRSGRLSTAQAREGFAAGRTVLVRHAERAHPRLREIADRFGAAFGSAIDIQLYVTPGGGRGFAWHYDLEEVLVLQCSGDKRFELRGNTVAKRPLPRPLPRDLGYERERSTEMFSCTLSAGDALYIPSGYWHHARALTDSFHASVGIMALPRS